MDQICLVQPASAHCADIAAYRQEFRADGESMDGSAGLAQCDSVEDWLEQVARNAREETVQEGWVPASTYLAIRQADQRLVGMVDIRHRLSPFLKEQGGHIGYSVRKDERRKGYATEILRLALQKCAVLGIERVLLTCDADNVASERTIRNNGGTLENVVDTDEGPVMRFWIDPSTE